MPKPKRNTATSEPAVETGEDARDEAGEGAETPVTLPAAVRLEAPYGYYAGDGFLRQWAQHQVVTDPEEIAHLTERGARVVPYEDPQ